MKNVHRIIEIFGGIKEVAKHYIRLEQPQYMRLVIEAIGPGPHGLPMVSVAHYGEQNGDAMKDPEMTFEIDAAGKWHPVTFENSYTGTYQEAVYTDPVTDKVMIRPKLVSDLKSFARVWDKNIQEQGWIDAAKQAASQRVTSN